MSRGHVLAARLNCKNLPRPPPNEVRAKLPRSFAAVGRCSKPFTEIQKPKESKPKIKLAGTCGDQRVIPSEI